MPLPKSETNMAKKKKRKPRCAQISFQSTRLAVAVVMTGGENNYFNGFDGATRNSNGRSFLSWRPSARGVPFPGGPGETVGSGCHGILI
jgi:hypothetical protein